MGDRMRTAGRKLLDLITGPVARQRGWRSVQLGENGARLVYDEDAEHSGRGLQSLASEYLCHHHVGEMLDLYGVNCVFDVGANTGQFGRELRRLGYTGRIVSFEPTSAAFGQLSEAAADDREWHVHRLALGRENTLASIHTGWDTMNSLRPPSDYGRVRYERFTDTRTEEVPVRRLDAVMDEALAGIEDPRPFLKMDTQGYDLEVFTGAGDRIWDFVGLVSEVALLRLYEGSPRMSEAVARYEAAEFEITGIYSVSRDPATGRVVEFDCVMMRAKAAPPR
ncbi:FkbM family methyltransferase [Streptomyces sp. NPDC047081]|uniref:FkbM family methyltransferase n=1 Tax=Streptomyces sp. NPDC047081 TaxID=3154706 RepID=UPI0033F02044